MKKEVKKKLKKQFREDGKDVGNQKQQGLIEENNNDEQDQINLQDKQHSASKDQQQQQYQDDEQDKDQEGQKSSNSTGNSNHNPNHPHNHNSSTPNPNNNNIQSNHGQLQLSNQKLRNMKESIKSEEDDEKVDDDVQQNQKEENEEPVIDVEEIRNRLRLISKNNSSKQDQSTSSEDEEEDEEYINELRERVVTISQFESQHTNKNKLLIASESSEQENYYRLFQKPEQETENNQENDDNDEQEENSDASPKQEYDLEDDEDCAIEEGEEKEKISSKQNSPQIKYNKSPQITTLKEETKLEMLKDSIQNSYSNRRKQSNNNIKLTSCDNESMNQSIIGTTLELTSMDPQDQKLLNTRQGRGGINSGIDNQKSYNNKEDSSNNIFGDEMSHTVKDGKKQKKKKKFKWETYKRMLRYSRKQWKLSFLGHFFLLLQSITQVLIPSFSGRLLDATIKERDLDKLNDLAFQAILIFLVNGLSSFFRTFLFSLIGERVVIDLRNDCFSKFIFNEISFHDKQHSGELISRLGNDISTAKAAASGNISTTIRNVIICVVIAVMIPVFILTSSVYGRYLKKLTKKYQDYSAKVSSHASECFTNIKTVKAFSNEDKEIFKYNEVMKQCYEIGYNKSFSSGLYNCINSMVSDFATLAVLWYGGYLVLQQSDLTSGQLASVILYTGSLASATSSISSSLSKIVTATGASDRLFKLMDKKPKIKSQGGIKYDNFRGEITFKNVGFYYKSTRNVVVLQDFNLEIKPGERVALVGQSGSGKSTVIRLIERFYDASYGTLTIDGYNIKELDLQFLHSHIGYVSQEPLLFSGTIEENITYGLKNGYTRKLLDDVCKLANSYDFIHDTSLFPLGYKTIVGEAGSKLSGGQKQRIAISRALILQPKILIFDEATSALDSESEFQVQQAIDELMNKKKDMTIIIIAHRLSTIVNCEKIVVISKGTVIETGNHKELIEYNGVYKQLVDRQMQGLTTS